MLTFLFWNLKGSRQDILSNLVRTHSVDVLMLAECPIKAASVLATLNHESVDFFYPQSSCPKIAIYTRFSDQYVLPQDTGDDFTIQRLALPGRPEILLCVVHFPSKLRQDPIDQTMYAVKFSELLVRAEETVSHCRTLLVGDLNMNPYEDGVVATRCLHAVMTREIARRPSRKVKFESNPYFYNPMWAHFGERNEGHAGTYYFSSPKARADFWNIYDQLLLRADLLPYFRNEDLEVLHHDRSTNVSFLTSEGYPDRESVSDHLPILFRLHI
jgi:hypothetical protein